MATPNLQSLIDDADLSGAVFGRLCRHRSLASAGCLRSLPEGVIEAGEDARVLPVRGLYFRRDALAAGIDPRPDITLRPEPENEHDPFAVAVDVDGTHVGYLPKEVAVSYQSLVESGSCRVAAFWIDSRFPPESFFLLLAWR